MISIRKCFSQLKAAFVEHLICIFFARWCFWQVYRLPGNMAFFQPFIFGAIFGLFSFSDLITWFIWLTWWHFNFSSFFIFLILFYLHFHHIFALSLLNFSPILWLAATHSVLVCFALIFTLFLRDMLMQPDMIYGFFTYTFAHAHFSLSLSCLEFHFSSLPSISVHFLFFENANFAFLSAFCFFSSHHSFSPRHTFDLFWKGFSYFPKLLIIFLLHVHMRHFSTRITTYAFPAFLTKWWLNDV